MTYSRNSYKSHTCWVIQIFVLEKWWFCLFWVCTSFLCCPMSTRFSLVPSQNIGLYYLSLWHSPWWGGAGNVTRRTPVPSDCAFTPSVLPVFLFCRDIPLIVVLLCMNVTWWCLVSGRGFGALGSCHTHHVRAGLLAHLAQRPQVLHRHWCVLLSFGSGRLHHLPHSCHHRETK